jgi:hypothetical protein
MAALGLGGLILASLSGCWNPLNADASDLEIEVEGQRIAPGSIERLSLPSDGTSTEFAVSEPGNVYLLATRNDRSELTIESCSIDGEAFGEVGPDVLNLPNERDGAGADELIFSSFGRSYADAAGDYAISCDMPGVKELLLAHIPG